MNTYTIQFRRYLFFVFIIAYILSFFIISYDGLFGNNLIGLKCATAIFNLFLLVPDFVEHSSIWTLIPHYLFLIFIASSNIIVLILIIYRFIKPVQKRILILLSIIAYLSVFFWLGHAIYKNAVESLKSGYYLWNISILGILLINIFNIDYKLQNTSKK